MTEPYRPDLFADAHAVQVEREGRVGIVRWNRPDHPTSSYLNC